ncbi:uncharacterized protein EI97DRAFT_434526 [Westerdykella ornata]|uniref:Ankyrin n=1 Tax=Westerdykella ornata TaxID=318751 RepID=A0A6A6JF66_WESOR|nr:uncharacterized protein EI97DRAFT_434526 [Westerdykella ornata]KAF2274957.1 hypothetical protein EI97DRAFT_434526 [Westerdykella ornata]
MTSNGEAAPLLHPPPVGNEPQDRLPTSPPPSPPPHTASPNSPKSASAASSRQKRVSDTHLRNGNHPSEDLANESEAETVVLGDAGEDALTDLQSIKLENHNGEPSVDEVPHGPNCRSLSPDADQKDSNNTEPAHPTVELDAKSPVPTSPSSRTTSRHTKDTSPTDSAKSSGRPAASPPLLSDRGRSSPTTAPRKRKLRDESHPKALEPPRQKAKTEGLQPSGARRSSPATSPGVARPHKRSHSTQSAPHNGSGRRRKDLTPLTLPQDLTHWSESSSERSSSPRPSQTPHALLPPRPKRSSHRALTSPARAMGKRNVDQFGATRLARESEKGDLEAVKAAYETAPLELDQEDFAGITPLQKAALNGHTEVVKFLLDKRCQTDCEANNGDTPLIDAVENDHLEIVRLLLDQGHVNPHHQNKKGKRAIDLLRRDRPNYEEIEKALKEAMKKHVDTTSKQNHAHLGARQKVASRLLYNEFNTETMIEKAGEGDAAAVGELLMSNIKPNIACGVAASRGGHEDVLGLLLAYGLKADPDPAKHSETPMLVAIGRGHIEIIKLLLKQDTFNPTRRNREGKTYWEISEERMGPRWEEERDELKKAFDEYRNRIKSPKRLKKEIPIPATIRAKKKSSPSGRDRSSSPQQEPHRAHPAKSSAVPQAPQKARRLMTGKEIANREGKRRRRVVSEDSSDDESHDEARPPPKKEKVTANRRSQSEEPRPVKKYIKRVADGAVFKRPVPAHSGVSDDEARGKRNPKIRTKTAGGTVARPSISDADSLDERKPLSKAAKSRLGDDATTRRRASDASMDHASQMKRPPTLPSAKSTPGPPDEASPPDSIREQHQGFEKHLPETQKKKGDTDAQKAKEQAARQSLHAEEVQNRMAAEIAAKRQAEEAEAVRKQKQEEARRREAEEARVREELEQAAREVRVSKLPRALQRACKMGLNRPLRFRGREMGISAVFLPLWYAKGKDIGIDQESAAATDYILSHQVVGILGLPELDLNRLGPPYNTWTRFDVTREQRKTFMARSDIVLLAQDFRFPQPGDPDFDYDMIMEREREVRQQFLDMDGLYWVEEAAILPEMEKVEYLRPLLGEIKDPNKRERIRFKGISSPRRGIRQMFEEMKAADAAIAAEKAKASEGAKAVEQAKDVEQAKAAGNTKAVDAPAGSGASAG